MRPALNSVFHVRILKLENDKVGAEFGLVGQRYLASAVVVVLHQGYQSSVQLFAILLPVVCEILLFDAGHLV